MGVFCLFSGHGERTLQVEVFAQGAWQDGRVQGLVHLTRKQENQAFQELGKESLALLIAAPGTSAKTTEGSQNELRCRSQHEQTPPPSALSPQRCPPPTHTPGQAVAIVHSELQIWVPPHPPTPPQGSPALSQRCIWEGVPRTNLSSPTEILPTL